MLNERTEILEVPTGTNLKSEAEKNFWCNLKWHCLFCLIENMGHLSITTLASKSGLSIAETVKALESMELIGFIKKTDSGYVQTHETIHRVSKNTDHHIEIISQYLLSSAQANNRILETITTGKHKTKSTTYNSTKELAEELHQKILLAVHEFKQKSEAIKPKWDGVYNFSASLIEMTGEV